MDILKRRHAPITDAAWNEIDSQAKKTLLTNLSCRRFLDVLGPKGITYTVKPEGTLFFPEKQDKKTVCFGTYTSRPLIEARVEFELDIFSLDNYSRGATDVDLSAVDEAARKIARFEEDAIYNGCKAGAIAGLKTLTEHNAVPLKTDSASSILEAIAKAVIVMRKNGIEGPYTLVASDALYAAIAASSSGISLWKEIGKITEGAIVYNPSVPESYFVSTRGGDLEIDIGVDFSIGYTKTDGGRVTLFLMESFTMNAPEPNAALRFV